MAGLAWIASACTKDFPPCYAGEYTACTCNDGARGYAACLPSQEGYAACVCDGRVPGLDASLPDAADAAEAGSKLGFLAPCQKDEQCETGLCFPFNAYGPHCSLRCNASTPCPAPSPGCSGMGVCKFK